MSSVATDTDASRSASGTEASVSGRSRDDWYRTAFILIPSTCFQGSCNIGFNFGEDADDPLPFADDHHLRIHVIPRNPNDTNFMWWSTKVRTAAL